jgi:hypothetical protein
LPYSDTRRAKAGLARANGPLNPAGSPEHASGRRGSQGV